VLSVQCPWRIERDGLVITGRNDVTQPVQEMRGEQWNYDEDGNLQDVAFASLLQSKAPIGRSARNETSLLFVQEVDVQGPCDLSLTFSGGYSLRVFADGTKGVQWRFFSPDRDETAVVIEDGLARFGV
jgi:hypothetical protein